MSAINRANNTTMLQVWTIGGLMTLLQHPPNPHSLVAFHSEIESNSESLKLRQGVGSSRFRADGTSADHAEWQRRKGQSDKRNGCAIASVGRRRKFTRMVSERSDST